MTYTAGTTPPRRLSRETRHLLIAALTALVALWVLARLRFPDAAPTPNPISPLLTQLATRPAFAELESELARLQARLAPALVSVSERPSRTAAGGTARAALRLADGLAVALVVPGAPADLGEMAAVDYASGLAVIRVDPGVRVSTPVPWIGDQLAVPRYIVAAVPAGDSIAFQPMLIAGLTPQTHPAWSGEVWRISSGAAPPDGAILFTHGGELLGATTAGEDRSLVIPGDVLLTDARRLMVRGPRPGVDVGFDVQPMTAALAAATGASSGVVLTQTRSDGPLGGDLRIGDVIVELNGEPIRSLGEWRVQVGRLVPGQSVVLTVVRDGARRTETTTAADATPRVRTLGLILRAVARTGSEVLAVEPGSAAAAAGLRAGDLVVSIGPIDSPSPRQIADTFAALTDRPVVVGVQRGDTQRVLALGR